MLLLAQIKLRQSHMWKGDDNKSRILKEQECHMTKEGP